MVFHPSRRKPELDNLNVTIHGHDIERVQQTKFLGITLHQNLSWTAHINAINSKVSKTIGILYKARQYLEISTLRLLYNSLILPYLQYCTIVWASTYKTHLNRLFLYQKRAVRIISHSPPLAHSRPLFNQMKILNIFEILVIK